MQQRIVNWPRAQRPTTDCCQYLPPITCWKLRQAHIFCDNSLLSSLISVSLFLSQAHSYCERAQGILTYHLLKIKLFPFSLLSLSRRPIWAASYLCRVQGLRTYHLLKIKLINFYFYGVLSYGVLSVRSFVILCTAFWHTVLCHTVFSHTVLCHTVLWHGAHVFVYYLDVYSSCLSPYEVLS